MSKIIKKESLQSKQSQSVPRLLQQKELSFQQTNSQQKIICFNADFEQCDKTDGQSNDQSQITTSLKSKSVTSFQQDQYPINSKLIDYQNKILQCLNNSNSLKGILKQNIKLKQKVQKAIKLQSLKYKLVLFTVHDKKPQQKTKKKVVQYSPVTTRKRRKLLQKNEQQNQITSYINKKQNEQKSEHDKIQSKTEELKNHQENPKIQNKLEEKEISEKESKYQTEKSTSKSKKKTAENNRQKIDIPDLKISRKNNLTEIHLNLSEFLSKKGLEDYELNVTFHK